jgi:glycosyltransferase involved in cell wall biosynthesis
MKAVLVVGHKPPPVTGENLCRLHLEVTLRELGVSVYSRSRTDLRNLFAINSTIWLIAGSSKTGHIRDFIFLLWWRLLNCHINIYIHNISWRYFLRYPNFIRFLGFGHFRFIVLTDEVELSFKAKRLNVFRLNNTLADGFESFSGGSRDPIPRLLWMGAVTYEKGFLDAYKIFIMLRAIDPRWRFDVYGNGPLSSDKTRFRGADFHGFISSGLKQAALDKGGIFILPSRYFNETQPLSIIEALANGIPFVASTIGGIQSMAGKASIGPAGICISLNQPTEVWVEAIQAIYSDYARFSRAALKVYRDCFSRAAYRNSVSSLL